MRVLPEKLFSCGARDARDSSSFKIFLNRCPPSGGDMLEVIVDAKTVGNMLGISERHVRRLVNEGILTRVKNGQYDIVECGRRYIENIREKQQLTDKLYEKLKQELLAEQVLHERAKKRKAELVVAEMEGSMHNAQDIERLWGWTVTSFKTRIRALPLKIAPQIQHINDLAEINTILHREIDEALMELSGYDPDKFFRTAGNKDEDSND